MDTMTLQLDSNVLAPFHDGWRAAVAQQSARDCESLLFTAQERGGAINAQRAPEFVRQRLACVPDMVAMLRDRSWDAAEPTRMDFRGALSYLADPYDLIADSQPRFGLLDDALVLEMALDANRREWTAWREFDAFRRHYGTGQELGRDDWLFLRRRIAPHGSALRRTWHASAHDALATARHGYRGGSGVPERFRVQ